MAEKRLEKPSKDANQTSVLDRDSIMNSAIELRKAAEQCTVTRPGLSSKSKEAIGIATPLFRIIDSNGKEHPFYSGDYDFPTKGQTVVEVMDNGKKVAIFLHPAAIFF